VGVPAEVARHVKPSLVREARADVLDRAGQDVTCARDDDTPLVGWRRRSGRAERSGLVQPAGAALLQLWRSFAALRSPGAAARVP
jgi:hypothetical protein